MCYLLFKFCLNKEKCALCLKYRLMSHAQDHEATLPLCRAQEPTYDIYGYGSWPCTVHFV